MMPGSLNFPVEGDEKWFSLCFFLVIAKEMIDSRLSREYTSIIINIDIHGDFIRQREGK